MSTNKVKDIVKLLKNTPEVECPLVANKNLDELKTRLVNCLYTDNFCSLCLTHIQPLELLRENFSIPICNENRVISLLTILRKGLHIEVSHLDNHSLICLQCRAKAISSYLFITETKNNLKAIHHYMSQFDDGIQDNIMDVDEEATRAQSNVVLILQDPDPNKAPITDSEMDNEAKPAAFICHFCGERKNTKSAITLHYRKNHGVCKNITTNTVVRKRPKCIECKTTLGCVHSKYIMYYQNQRRSGKMLSTCRACPFQCWGKRCLLDHIDEKHLDYYKYSCEPCQKKFSSNIAYKFHMRKYHMELHKCEYCDSVEYTSKERLLKHQATCKNVKREFVCDQCPATFDTEKKLVYHKNKHKNTYQCSLCTKTFVTEYKLKSHQRFHILIENEKNQTYRNKCSICEMQLYNVQDFKAHVAQSHKPEDKHHCSPCDQDFDTRIQFLNHLSKYSHKVKLNPNIKKPFECAQCDYSSTSATALESHVNRFHLRIKPFKCELCPKSFTDSQKLKLHAKTHSTVKTHKCLYCSQYFCGPSALKLHIRRHTGEKPYPCSFCNQCFISSTMVMAHQRRQHYAKSVKCPKCSSMFPHHAAMRLHFKRVHWEFKTEMFDINRVEGLTEEQRDMFRDRRIMDL